ncbi:two pore domain potassium channel family protein [Sphingomonas sp. HDW15A]|uniref:potassium channel family protein n=1 Tax=Sphingomonas sp. HDW15A TaxID=2714942 RepID=UPI00140C968B|nr:potassium channel family protein [Sphingomonas sp. HDW15A]QIK95374.1 two pore domain potassium channel family protein [Sphingomonas sp. HDW15A]
MLLMLVALPVAPLIGLPQMIIKLLLGLCLLAAVLPEATKSTRLLVTALIAILVFARYAADRHWIPVDTGWLLGAYGLIGLMAAAAALRFAMTSERVGSETIYAALGTYLLAGVFFGQIYWSLESAVPGSFVGPDPFSDTRAIYYSFVTLATLGYGDYVPRSDLARGIATFEVIGGQLYLAALVARLIGAIADDGRKG